MAATLFSRPTPSGTTSLGNTTASRSGTSGRSFGNWFGCAFVVVVSGSVTSSFSLLLVVRGRVDLDGARLLVLGLRQNELEHTVREFRLDFARVDLHRDGERPLELAEQPLLTEPALVRHIGAWLRLSADRDGVGGHVDLDVIVRETREVRPQRRYASFVSQRSTGAASCSSFGGPPFGRV